MDISAHDHIPPGHQHSGLSSHPCPSPVHHNSDITTGNLQPPTHPPASLHWLAQTDTTKFTSHRPPHTFLDSAYIYLYAMDIEIPLGTNPHVHFRTPQLVASSTAVTNLCSFHTESSDQHDSNVIMSCLAKSLMIYLCFVT